METYIDGPPIHPGFDWRVRIQVNHPIFDPEEFLVAHVRQAVGRAEILASLSTVDGTLTCIGPTEIELLITGDKTTAWRMKSVIFDLARDRPALAYMGFRIEVPLDLTVTRGLA